MRLFSQASPAAGEWRVGELYVRTKGRSEKGRCAKRESAQSAAPGRMSFSPFLIRLQCFFLN
jgi:hypothetical protein